jgi:mannose-6-phosphate isomerase-like protein (cupin superfamily)
MRDRVQQIGISWRRSHIQPLMGKLLRSKVLALSLVAALGAMAPCGTSSADTPAPARYTIDNCVNTFSAAGAEKTGAGSQYWLFGKSFAEGKTLKLSVVGPHKASHAPHRHVEDEFFFVLDGKAEFYLDGKTRVVGPNTGLYCPSGSEHGIRNVGDGELRYLVIKDYPPEPPQKP